MPYSFVIDNNAEVIRETWRGTFNLADLIESCHREWAHPDYRSGLNMLTDFRNAKGRLTADDVLQFASWFSNDDAPARHAIVVRRERAFDFANMFSMIRESVEAQGKQASTSETRLFFSYAEANAWIEQCALEKSQS